MNFSKSFLTVSLLAFSLTQTPYAKAGTIEVLNENKKELKVKIKAEGSATESLATHVQHISAEHMSKFLVESSTLDGKSHFSIEGQTSMFTPGSTCKNLSVDKDYKVTFQNATAGTTCLAEEIQK